MSLYCVGLNKNVIDLRHRTNLRQLVRLVYHAQGVLCPVTSLMHLAAGVPVKEGMPKNRACVVVAGGREPSHWEAYPHHQFMHTNGALLCCDSGGCWKARTRPLGDGDERDRPNNLCVDVANGLPRCMDMIRPADVIRRIEMYFEGEAINYLARPQARAASKTVACVPGVNGKSLDSYVFKCALDAMVKKLPSCPHQLTGRGIIIAGGGRRYCAPAWVCIQMLRHLGCKLPIQLWHLGPSELDEHMKSLVEPLGVECVDALEVRKKHPARILNGWELKPYAMLHSPFQEVLFLDADNMPVANPEFLFDAPEYKQAGAVFWPDYGELGPRRAIWGICGVKYRKEPEFESGQILVDKVKCWRELQLTMWMNEHSDFFYRHIHGDKETFHMAWRKLDRPYAMPAKRITSLTGTMCQHDFSGQRLFQHRNASKWRLAGNNDTIPGFLFEKQCVRFLRELRQLWSGDVQKVAPSAPAAPATAPVWPLVEQELAPAVPQRPAPGKRIVFRGPIDAYTGYGLHSCQIIRDLQEVGYEVAVLPTHEWDAFAPVPLDICSKILREPPDDAWELMLHPPNRRIRPGKSTIFFTMWEASRLPRQWVE